MKQFSKKISEKISEKIHKKTLIRFAVVALLALAIVPLRADDTEIYQQAMAEKPMVLIIMDNSGSMADPVSYDRTVTYAGSYTAVDKYKQVCTKKNKKGVCTAIEWQVYAGAFTDNWNDDSGVRVAGFDGIDDSSALIRTGNRLNYEATPVTSKISMAKGVLNALVEQMYDQVEFGFMKFNTDDGGNLISKIGATQTAIQGQISAMNATTWTPLAETLSTAGKYFEDTMTGQFSPFNCDTWCRRAFVIVITDGEPTHDTDKAIIGHFLDRGQSGITDSNRGEKWDQDGDYYKHSSTLADPLNVNVWVADDTYSENVPQTFMPDVAKYLYSHDLRPDLQGTQNITTYTIGFLHDSPLLQKTAANGGGLYLTANSASQLEDALMSALDDITKKMQTYTAPVVPVTRSSSGDKMYLAFFKPLKSSNFWTGDLQKYSLSFDNQILDAAGNPATDSGGAMLDAAVPIWSVEQKLKTRAAERAIYTFFGSSSLTDASNSFSIANANLTAASLGNPVKQDSVADPATSARDDLINFIRGKDSYDDNGNGSQTDAKDHILGDILHSVPLVIDYAGPAAADPQRYIFFGANDGMLHAINDTDGSEQWAFVPPELLAKLKLFPETSIHNFYVDGSAKSLVERDANGAVNKALLIFGLRDGGSTYTIIDVTNPAAPVYVARISPTTAGFGELGHTWSDPVVGLVKDKIGAAAEHVHRVAVFGGGFDPAQSGIPAAGSAAAGRGIFVADLETGGLLRSFVHDATNGLDYAIPSQVLAVDRDFDGYMERLYVGDLGGNLWRIGQLASSSAYLSDWGLRKQFTANPGSDASSGRRFFYPPDIAFGPGYDTIVIGSGDRDNPRTATATVDRLYGLRDYSPASGFVTQTEAALTDMTAATTAAPAASGGWYVRLLRSAEKALAAPVVFNSYTLFTTFSPNVAVCDVGGSASLYAIGTNTGIATRYSIGTGIPTEPTIVVRSSGTTAFAGAGAGVVNLSTVVADAGSVNNLDIGAVFDFPVGVRMTSWRELF